MDYLLKRVQQLKNGEGKELIWILEHPKTYTAGVSFNQKDILSKKFPYKEKVNTMISTNNDEIKLK